MKTPSEIKFELDRRLLSLANERGLIPLITNIHSIVCEGNTVSVIFDITPDKDGSGLYFEFERPQLVSRAELGDFSRWLAWSGRGETLH